ncbi:MAG: hypothetical protein V4665_02460 [Patescibacteria group bacterium]
MRKSITHTTLALLLVFSLLAHALLPLQAYADNQYLNYDNPNAGGNNPYKVSARVITPELLTSVVSCTGIENKIAAQLIALNDVIQKELDKVLKKAEEFIRDALFSRQERIARERALEQARKAAVRAAGLAAGAASATVAGSGSPGAGQALVDIVTDAPRPSTQVVELSGEERKRVDDAEKERAKNAAQVERRERAETCLNGIAVALARNQLTSFTKYTMNWISTGFNGDPMFVRNVDQFMDSITREILEKENALFKDPANAARYPFGRDYARGQVESYKASKDPYGALESNLTDYLPPGTTTENFGRDFRQGGWDGWLGLTQRPQNNPLGFVMEAKDVVVGKQETAITNLKDELAQNGGYLSQKKCADPRDYDSTSTDPAKNTCTTWETVTPGSTIRDKISVHINTPERQLELVKTMDDALNALFAALLSKFQNQGLSSLSSQANNAFSSISGGFGNNSLYDASGNVINVNTNNTGSSGSGNSNGPFDLIRDLGNQYVNAIEDGTWNANTNSPFLRPGVGSRNHFYTVSVGGTTRLFDQAYTWQRGDKALFDGETWKVGVPRYVINKKGVLQLQYDYLAKAEEAIDIISAVTPSLGRLDHCIPGPNPNWRLISTDRESSFLTLETGDANIDELFDEYSEKIQALYGPTSLMQSSGNTAYLEMSPAGLALTQDIESYAEIMSEKKAEYEDSISTTRANIEKLNVIKDKVNVIITAAQNRRNAKRAQEGKPPVTALCLATEKVTYVQNDILK